MKTNGYWKPKDYLAIALMVIGLWIAITSAIYRFSNPRKTETEAFLHIPKSFILNFRD